jgi:hypothetical protein
VEIGYLIVIPTVLEKKVYKISPEGILLNRANANGKRKIHDRNINGQPLHPLSFSLIFFPLSRSVLNHVNVNECVRGGGEK